MKQTVMTKNIIIITLICLVMAACSTGKRALEHGNYSEAVFKSIDRLRGNPKSKNASITLKEAYPLAVQTLEAEIQEQLSGSAEDKYARVALKYKSLQDMTSAIRRSPAALSIIPSPRSYQNEWTGAKKMAGEEALNRGVHLLDQEDRLSAREAYFAFQSALEFDPKLTRAKELAEAAREMATLVVAVEPIPVPGRYKLDSDFFYKQLLKYLNQSSNLEFVAFLPPREAKQWPHTDHLLVMDFFDFQVGASKETHKEKELTSKDSVKIGTATVDGKKVDVYNLVTAKFTEHTRQVSSSGILQVKIINARNNRLIERKKFPGTYVWETEWASFNGDKRALTTAQLERCRKKPAPAPPPQDLFYEFTKPIFDQTKSFLRSYYRKF